MTDIAARPEQMTDAFAREWVDRYCAAWNSHRPEELVGLANEDVLWEDPGIYPDGVSRNRNFLTEWVPHLLRALPDLKVRVLGEPAVSLDRSRLMFEWETSGTFTGPLDPPGFAPTGGPLVGRGFDCHTFRDGLLAHVCTVTDVGDFARQIGAMPPPGSLGEKLAVRIQHLGALRLRRKV